MASTIGPRFLPRSLMLKIECERLRVSTFPSVDERLRGSLIEIRITADGFLRYMVRAIAGTLMAIGRGELDTDDLAQAFEIGARPTVAATAPACGLTLLSVRYQ